MNTLTQVSNFANNAAAVEKTLRLAQSVTLIGAGLHSEYLDSYVTARGHFNISRRYLRIFKWVDSFNAATASMSSSKASVPKLIETAKFTFLGLYFLLEMLTLGDAMGLTKLEAGPLLVIQASRFWFYGLLCSIAQAVWEGLSAPRKRQLTAASREKAGGKGSAEKRAVGTGARRGLPYKQLAIDACDLCIPGAVLQWIPFSQLTVGIAMAISTLLQLSDMWPRVQAQAAAASAQKK